MSDDRKISALRSDRLRLLQEGKELRQQAETAKNTGARKSVIDRLQSQADDKDRLAQQKLDDINTLAQPSLF